MNTFRAKIPYSLVHAKAAPVRARATSFRLFRAKVAAHAPVQEAERGGHHVADIREAEQHQGNAKNRVEYRHHFAPRCFWGNVAVT